MGLISIDYAGPAVSDKAMSINGATLEALVPGYRTIDVSGREPWQETIDTIQIDTVDGVRFRRKRMDARTISVSYSLIALTPEAFLTRYNALNAALNFEQAEIVFADESDKYFIGTFQKITREHVSRVAATGTITIYCSDPYKYSTTETEITAANGVASFNYDGTHPAYPVLEITCASNLGFAGAADDSGNVIQIGDPLEEGVDGTDSFDEDKSTTNVTATPPSSWSVNALGGLVNSGNAHSQTGTINTGTIEGATAVKANSWGTNNNKWHGPSICYNITTPVKNATLSWKCLIYASSNNQLGNFHAELRTASGASIAAVAFYRNSKGKKTALYDLYINGSRKKSVSFTMDKANSITGTKGGVCSIDKFGDTVTFNLGNKVYTLTDAAIADLTVGKVGFWFGRWNATTVLAANCVYSATVISHSNNAESYEKVPNKFQTGDVITVDCGEGTVYLNGVPKEGIGALGNDYETFTLQPGVNNIAFSCSDWAASAPTYKVKFRKAYI